MPNSEDYQALEAYRKAIAQALMSSSEQIRESRRLAWEWANSFKMGDRVEVLVGDRWTSSVVQEAARSMGWPIVRTYTVILARFVLVWYSQRKLIRRPHETA